MRSKHERYNRKEMSRRGSNSSMDTSNEFGKEGFDEDEPQSQHGNGFNRPFHHHNEAPNWRYRRFQRHYRKFLSPHFRRRFPNAGNFNQKQFMYRCGVPRDDFKNFEEYSHPLDEKKNQPPAKNEEKEKVRLFRIFKIFKK